MTELDAEIPGLSTELINEYGKVITYVERTSGDYNVNTSTADPVAAVPLSVKAVLEAYKGNAFTAGIIEAGDMKAYIAAESLASLPKKPTTGDQMIIDGATYTSINVQAIYSGELIALYEFHIRSS